jgi:excisionase family DNA binding protein
MEETFYTVAQLAKLAGCRSQMIYNYIHKGKIPFQYEGRYLIPKQDGDLWVKAYQERKEET